MGLLGFAGAGGFADCIEEIWQWFVTRTVSLRAVAEEKREIL
jgi:hypothetical protein